MKSAERISLTITLLLALGGCNDVVSLDPWFTTADAGGAPKFRDGLWLTTSKKDCRVNVAKPAERWPKCAGSFFVRGDERWQMDWDDGRRRRAFLNWERDPSLIVSGDPLIAQLDMADMAEQTSTPPVASVDAKETGELSWRYFYFAIRPTRLDDRGNVVAFESWGVKCGPLAEPMRASASRDRASGDFEPPELETQNVTDRPFPGLTVIEYNCTAESVDALRRAATLSEPLETHRSARWVREGWH